VNDLTVIMTTANRVPFKWAEYHKEMLFAAIGDMPLITISFKPLDFGRNLIQKSYGLANVYWQILRGAKAAKTKYVAIVEDDTLYPKEHFEYRPETVGYDLNRWTVFTWGDPVYMHKPHVANCGMVANKEVLVNALQSRFDKYGNDLPKYLLKEVGRYEKQARVPTVEIEKFYSKLPYVCFVHEHGVDPASRQKKKKVWPVQAYDIPKWGKVDKLRENFK